MIAISVADRAARLARRHALVPGDRAVSVAAAADAVVALHSSDPTSVYLSVAARHRGATVAAVDHALYEERSLVRHHAMRRTIWAMRADVATAANAGFTRKIALAERRRTEVMFGEDHRWVADGIERVTEAVERHGGPVSTRTVGGLLPDLAEQRAVNAGKPYEGTMAPHTRLLLCAGFEGRIIRGRPAGTWIGSQYEWWPTAAWHDLDWSRPEVTEGAIEVVRRYLAQFGPVTLDDIVWWTGSTKTLARRALATLDAAEVGLDDGAAGFVLPDDTGPVEPTPSWVALLPGLDPTAMGWKLRDWYLPPDVARRVTDRNGNIGPTVWADGSVVGGWAQRPDGSIAHDARDLSPEHTSLLATEIERVRDFVGETRFSVRFPAPNQRELLA